jgi:transcriptional regulator with GAF, ATPase, and Fis domain
MNSASIQLVGRSIALRHVESEASAVAATSAKVLITGESGVGKELIAQLLHARSPQRDVPLVTLNCAGVPDSLLESELFGHMRGSFTDAYRDKTGLLQMAHGGMIFLDEIGEMSPRMQALLLRFLETGEIQPIGATAAVARVNARVVCATNRDLLERVDEGHFRGDLYYRLNVVHLTIPPLRDRPEDVVDLLEHFRSLFADRYGRVGLCFADDALQCLTEYAWPGNVRELKNVVERIVLRAHSGCVTVNQLPAEVRFGARQRPSVAASSTKVDQLLADMMQKRATFWSAVQAPFMRRDLTREDIRALVGAGLERARGNIRILVELFNMPARDQRRFLSFLRKHDCHQRVLDLPDEATPRKIVAVAAERRRAS